VKKPLQSLWVKLLKKFEKIKGYFVFLGLTLDSENEHKPRCTAVEHA